MWGGRVRAGGAGAGRVVWSDPGRLPEGATPGGAPTGGEPAARLLSPGAEAAWTAAMLRLLGVAAARQPLIEAGRAQVGRFTWGRAARQLAALYERLLARP